MSCYRGNLVKTVIARRNAMQSSELIENISRSDVTYFQIIVSFTSNICWEFMAVHFHSWCCIRTVQFSHSVASDSFWPHGWQHARTSCPSPTPRVYSNSCPLSQWCHPTISSSVVPFSCPQSYPASIFSNESALCITWPKYLSFSFSISPSNEHPGLISFRMDWLDLLAAQGTLNSLLQHHSSKASILWSSALFMVQLSQPYMTLENP